jgi:hypothetical protein
MTDETDYFFIADHTLGIVEVHPRAIPGMRSGLVSIRYGMVESVRGWI